MKTKVLLPTPSVISTETEYHNAIDLLINAFHQDPAVRWLFPDEETYPLNFGRFVNAFTQPSFDAGTMLELQSFSAAAAWIPPDVRVDEDAVMTVVEAGVPEERREDAFHLFEQMDAYHPQQPYAYLTFMGVLPALQGKRLGSNLLHYILSDCKLAGTPLYLESSNCANIPLYERHGFRALGQIQSGSSPVITPMLRAPSYH